MVPVPMCKEDVRDRDVVVAEEVGHAAEPDGEPLQKSASIPISIAWKEVNTYLSGVNQNPRPTSTDQVGVCAL